METIKSRQNPKIRLVRALRKRKAREAENLVKTRIEPFVREANAHTRELMQSRWRKYLKGAIEILALGAGGFLSLDLGREVVKKAIRLAAESRGEPQPQAPAASTRFVLEVRRQYTQRYNY